MPLTDQCLNVNSDYMEVWYMQICCSLPCIHQSQNTVLGIKVFVTLFLKLLFIQASCCKLFTTILTRPQGTSRLQWHLLYMTVADITKLLLVTIFNTTACFPNIWTVIFHISLQVMFCNCAYKTIIAIIAEPSYYRLQTAFIFFFPYWKLFRTESSGFQWDLW
jgi:hypothetical protein